MLPGLYAIWNSNDWGEISMAFLSPIAHDDDCWSARCRWLFWPAVWIGHGAGIGTGIGFGSGMTPPGLLFFFSIYFIYYSWDRVWGAWTPDTPVNVSIFTRRLIDFHNCAEEIVFQSLVFCVFLNPLLPPQRLGYSYLGSHLSTGKKWLRKSTTFTKKIYLKWFFVVISLN